jgi:hypothetical protein
MDFPKFDGEDQQIWLHNCELYFFYLWHVTSHEGEVRCTQYAEQRRALAENYAEVVSLCSLGRAHCFCSGALG